MNDDGTVKCPCKRCVNKILQTIDVLEAHIIDHGFHLIYTAWIYHGKRVYLPTSIDVLKTVVADKMIDILHDVVRDINIDVHDDAPQN